MASRIDGNVYNSDSNLKHQSIGENRFEIRKDGSKTRLGLLQFGTDQINGSGLVGTLLSSGYAVASANAWPPAQPRSTNRPRLSGYTGVTTLPRWAMSHMKESWPQFFDLNVWPQSPMCPAQDVTNADFFSGKGAIWKSFSSNLNKFYCSYIYIYIYIYIVD